MALSWFGRRESVADIESTLFDADWYLARYPEVAKAKKSPIQHFMTEGWPKNFNPCEFFDTAWYLSQYPDVGEAGLNPLIHYESIGYQENRLPSQDFDPVFYRAAYLEQDDNVNPLQHYLEIGRHNGNLTKEQQVEIFNAAWYLATYPDADESDLDPRDHFMQVGWRKGYDPSPMFDTMWYLKCNPDVRDAGWNPLEHYETVGNFENRRPNKGFDPAFYRAVYLSNETKYEPLSHYIHFGESQGNVPCITLMDAAFGASKSATETADQIWYRSQNPGGQETIEAGIISLGNYIKQAQLIDQRAPSFEQIESEWKREGAFPSTLHSTILQDCCVVPGTSTVFVKRNLVINDEISRMQGKVPDSSLVKNWETGQFSDEKLITNCALRVNPSIECGIHLFKENETNYSNFLVEVAPKLNLLESQLAIDPSVPLLVSNNLADTVYDLIDILKHPCRSVLRLHPFSLYKIRRLYMISDLSHIVDFDHLLPKPEHCFFPRRIVSEMVEKVITAKRSEDRIDRKIYLKRGKLRRAVANEAELIDVALKYGFEIVDMADLSLAAQVNYLASARQVIGATGAAFTNLLWCNENTKVMVFFSRHPLSNASFWERISEIKGLQLQVMYGRRVGKITGKHSIQDDYTIDPVEFERCLAKWPD